MSKKYTTFHNFMDFKDRNELWVQTFSPARYVCYHTRASDVWGHLLQRCKVNGAIQKEHETYGLCENKFKDFQEFAGWCVEEFGYLSKNKNDSYWSLDKDLIKPFNKVYSPDTCMFVPQKINTILLDCGKTRGSYPLGVSWNNTASRFQASCYSDGKKRYLGLFNDKFEAHRAWQLAKIKEIENLLLSEYHLIQSHEKLIKAIATQTDRIYQDYLNNLETGRRNT